MTRGRIAVAMSGGVDSSVTAALLKEQGYDVVGFSMQLYDQTRGDSADILRQFGRCCALDDLYDARQVASRLGIPHYVVNYEREFEQVVVRSFVEDYRNGITPSPCVLCNSRMKFDHLTRLAAEIGASHVATGHYARITHDPDLGRYRLHKGLNPDKDQSYFLFELRQEQLARAMFPLGDLDKSEVRGLARRYGLMVAEKPDSQEICFVPDGDYARFVERYLSAERVEEPSAGEIVNLEGKILGTHQGIHRYTIGQRRGLGIAHSVPLYVIDLKPSEKRVVVGERSALAETSFHAVRANWIAFPEPDRPLAANVKIRSRHAGAEATVTPLSDDAVQVEFAEPQMAITPGQAAVFYRDDEVIGGAWIAGRREGSKTPRGCP
jgi:tRNA-uridine 2-sulfurtransferase